MKNPYVAVSTGTRVLAVLLILIGFTALYVTYVRKEDPVIQTTTTIVSLLWVVTGFYVLFRRAKKELK